MEDKYIWLGLAHETDKNVRDIITDIGIFYEGFDKYMEAKIIQNEAYMAVDKISTQCIGIVAFSKKYNRITFLGVSEKYDFDKIGFKLIEYTLPKLDNTKDISTNVFKGNHERLLQVKHLYEKFGFVEYDNTIFEAGVPACMMKLYHI
jgi:GNAT superfamily N-acetyltransferase